jgi:hypothetical protein
VSCAVTTSTTDLAARAADLLEEPGRSFSTDRPLLVLLLPAPEVVHGGFPTKSSALICEHLATFKHTSAGNVQYKAISTNGVKNAIGPRVEKQGKIPFFLRILQYSL